MNSRKFKRQCITIYTSVVVLIVEFSFMWQQLLWWWIVAMMKTLLAALILFQITYNELVSQSFLILWRFAQCRPFLIFLKEPVLIKLLNLFSCSCFQLASEFLFTTILIFFVASFLSQSYYTLLSLQILNI